METAIVIGSLALVGGLLVVVVVARALSSHRFKQLGSSPATPIADVADGGIAVIRGVIATDPESGALDGAIDGRPVVYSSVELVYRAELRSRRTSARDLRIVDDTGEAVVRLSDGAEISGGHLSGSFSGDEVPDWMVESLAQSGLQFAGTPGTVTVREEILGPEMTAVVRGRARWVSHVEGASADYRTPPRRLEIEPDPDSGLMIAAVLD